MSCWKVLSIKRTGEHGEVLKAPRNRGVLFLGAVLALVGVLFFSGYAWAKKTVILVVDGEETSVQTFAGSVEDALLENSIIIKEKDEVTPEPAAPLAEGLVITVNRAAEVMINVDGQDIPAKTREQTVKAVLEEYGVKLGPQDEVAPAVETLVVPGLTIHVARLITEVETTEALIGYTTKNKYTTNIPAGVTRVAQEGREGKERQSWQVTYRDGKEINRQLASREVVTPVVDKVVMVGSGMVVSRGGKDIRYSEAMNMVASAYTHTGRNTASGVYPHHGAVAVDPSVIPLGTKLYVEGYGYATALDKGRAIKGNRIDLFFETRSEALKWGMKRIKVYKLD